MYELVGMKEVSFKGSDGAQVAGTNFYFTYDDPEVDGFATEKVFVSAQRFMKLSFVPELGGKCDLMYNKYGKIRDIVPA